MFSTIKHKLNRQAFQPGILGLFINPFYFARKGLYVNIRKMAHYVSGRVLDVGCGQKPYQSLFRVDEYVGMDIEQNGHDHKDENIDVFYDGKTFPFESATFDSVISNATLEHVFNPDEHLAEIHRILKPGGIFLITVPFMWDEHEQPYDYGRYSSFGLRHLLEQNGFEIIEQRKSGTGIRAIFQMINVYIFKSTLRLRKRYFHYFVTVFLNSPVNLLGELLWHIFPENSDLYLDNIVVAKKKG